MRLTIRPARRTSGAARPEKGRGQSVVEFALLVPVLLAMLLIAVDFGRLFFSYIQVQNAAREAAAYGAGSPNDQPGMQARADQERGGQGQAGQSTVTVEAPVCRNQAGTTIPCTSAPGGTGPGNTLTVSVSSPFSFLTPFMNNFFGGGVTLRAATTTAVFGAVPGAGSGSSASPCPPPTIATFVATSTGLTVTVDPAGSQPETFPCAISGYNWDFGWTNTDDDKDVGASLPITHTYPAAGTYTITLEVTNQGGTLTTTRTVTVPAPVPTPTPSPSASVGPSPSASASPSPSPSVSPSPSPSPTPSVCTVPTASFTWSSGSPRRNVTFTDRSTYPIGCPIQTWLWNFGDNTANSNAVNPVHSFPSNNGAWNVTLTVTNSAGSASVTIRVSL